MGDRKAIEAFASTRGIVDDAEACGAPAGPGDNGRADP